MPGIAPPETTTPEVAGPDHSEVGPLGNLAPPAGWYADPLAPERARRWDGEGWTAVIRIESPPPKRRRAEAAPPVEGISWVPWLPALGAPPRATRVGQRRRIGALTAVAAGLLVLAAAVASGALLPGSDQRPTVEPEITYRDTAAGFVLRYPETWEVLRRDPGEGVRFAVAAPTASTADTNTVSVAVGTDSAELPALHTLADQLTEKLRTELPGVQLELAERSKLAGAPALRFSFRDSSAAHPTRIDQWVGRTTAGRPLTITVTVREPRTAPSESDLAAFVASVEPT